MSRLNILIADDVDGEYRTLKKWLDSTILASDDNFLIQCEFINRNHPHGFEEILVKDYSIDIAFVDLAWEKESEKQFCLGENGGQYIIRKLSEKHPCCLIIAISKHISSIHKYPSYLLTPEIPFPAIAKDENNHDKTKRLYNYLEKWQISRIKQINNTIQWCKLLAAIEKDDYSGNVFFGGKEWLISDFLFTETILNNQTFFIRENLINEIKKLISYPKNKLWGTKDTWGKHTEVYFKFIELDEKGGFKKLSEIEVKAKDYINNFAEILVAKSNIHSADNVSNKAKNHQLRSHQCKEVDIPIISNISKLSDIPNDYFDNLLIRYIVLTLCHAAIKVNRPEWNNTYYIYELFDHVPATEDNVKMFYYYLGFNSNKKKSIKYSSYIDDVLFKEKDFLQNFDFPSLVRKITLNNQDNFK